MSRHAHRLCPKTRTPEEQLRWAEPHTPDTLSLIALPAARGKTTAESGDDGRSDAKHSAYPAGRTTNDLIGLAVR
jgi:hypothetical protein